MKLGDECILIDVAVINYPLELDAGRTSSMKKAMRHGSREVFSLRWWFGSYPDIVCVALFIFVDAP